MKKKIFLLLLSLTFYTALYAQVQFTQRLEIESKWADDDFIVLPTNEGIVGFRMYSERGNFQKDIFQYFVSDFQLETSGLIQFPLKDNFEIMGFDLDGELFYVLFQKGPSYNNEKIIYEINLKTKEIVNVEINGMLNSELQDFFVFNRKAVFMGNYEYRPVIQVFDVNSKGVVTVPGVFEKDAKILQMRKDAELEIFDVLMSRRDFYKNKVVSIITYDTDGNKLREVKIERLNDSLMEIVEGVLISNDSYKQALIGPFGLRRREAYQGMYFSQINEFGEYENSYYTLADFSNFYNYLPEKIRKRREASLERALDRGKKTPIRNVLTTREVIVQNGHYLVYNDHFVAASARYMPRDGMYYNNFYRMNPLMMGGFGGMNSPLWMDPGMRPGNTSSQYKFLSAQFLLLDEDGRIVWDNALNLENKSTNDPGKFGEISFDGYNLYYMYLDELQLKLSHLRDGEILLENETFEIELINENERIRDTQQRSLRLFWWYHDYYLLAGKQRIRYQNESGREETREVFFLTKIKVQDFN